MAKKPTLNFDHDYTRVLLAFPSDRQYAQFRDWVRDTYREDAVRTFRHKVCRLVGTQAVVICFPGLVAEIRGKAYGDHHGSTLDTQDVGRYYLKEDLTHSPN